MSWAQQWTDTILETFARLRAAVSEFIPSLLGALVILGVGYLVAKIVQKIAVAVLRRIGLDRAGATIGSQTFLERLNIPAAPSAIVGSLVFWFFMLVFVIAATDALGLTALSATAATVVAYLPNLLGALAIAVIGTLVARLAREGVRGGADRIGVEYARPLSQAAYGIVLVLVAALAISQLKLETGLVNRAVEVLLIAGAAAFALTLGLGTRDVAKNIVAGVYARDVYRPPMTLSVAGTSGSVEEVGAVNTRIRTAEGGTVYIPNGQLMEMIVHGTPARGEAH